MTAFIVLFFSGLFYHSEHILLYFIVTFLTNFSLNFIGISTLSMTNKLLSKVANILNFRMVVAAIMVAILFSVYQNPYSTLKNKTYEY